MASPILEPNGISIIICCFNSSQRLAETLSHLTRQSLNFAGGVELIIVDNNSSDDTSLVAGETWQKLDSPFPIQVILEPRQGQAYARQTGIENAKFSVILFVDDDNWLASNYLETGYVLMQNDPQLAVLGGSNEGVFDEEPPSWLDQPFPFQSLRHSLAIHNKNEQNGILSPSDYVFGAGSFYRKSALRHLDRLQFKPLLSGRQKDVLTSGDDEELCFALKIIGYKVLRNPEMKLKHYIPNGRLTWPYFKKLYFGYGLLIPVTELYKYYIENKSFFKLEVPKKINQLKKRLRRMETFHTITNKWLGLKHLKTELFIEKINGQLYYYENPAALYRHNIEQLKSFTERVQNESNKALQS